jgi:PAS domain S-box-containing protein
MSIYKRTIIMVCVSLLILMGLVYLISNYIYRQGFEDLERKTVENNVTQVTQALSVNLDTLDAMCYDWAEWDDTYQFVQEYNQEYVDRNLQDDTFTSSKISLVSIFNASEEIVYGKAYDLINEEEIIFPDDFTNTAITAGLATPAIIGNTVAGVILFTGQPMLIVSQPIFTSWGEGPIAGALIFGRIIDTDVISQLAETTHLSVNLLLIPADDNNPDTNKIIESLNESGPTFIQAKNSDTIAGYTYVNDLNGNPVFIAEVIIPRDIFHQGIKAITLLHSFLFCIGVVFCIVFILLVKKLVLSRLINLSNSVSKIGSSTDVSGRVTISGNDELSKLGTNINEMLASLDKADRNLRESEDLLRENNEQLDTILNSVPCGILVVDAETHIIQDANIYASNMIGAPAEEIIGKECHQFICPAERGKCPVTDLGKNIDHSERILVNINGDYIPVLKNIAYVTMGGSRYLLETFVDITERKKMEADLADEATRRRILIEQSRDGIVILDQNGAVYEANRRFAEMLGYSPEEALKLNVWDWEYQYPPEQVREMIRTVDEAGDHFTTRHRRKDGTTYDVEISTNAAKFGGQKLIFCVCRDISERARMEKALKESEEKFSKAFHSSPDCSSIVRARDGVFVDVNESFLNFHGRSREEVIGHTATELDIWANLEERDRILKINQEKGNIRNEEFHVRAKSGKIHIVLFSSEAVNIGEEPHSIAMTLDITEQKEAEGKLKEAISRLEQSSTQLAATNKELEAFSYSVSHDLRSPLRSIDGFSQALLEDYQEKLDETGRDYLKRLRNASQKMGDLIDGILKLSRLNRSEIHQEPTNLSVLAEEIANRLQEIQPERRVKFAIEKDVIANGDPQLLRVLLENLLGNAWKFTGKKSQAKIEFSTERNNGKKAYFIRDNGAGFDMTYANKLFGAFQRLHEATEFPGTGIGLATVQRIINRHGGSIWAEGAVGKGATFHFTLD